MIFESVGKLHYSHNNEYGHRLVLDIDQGIVDYYRALVPKYIRLNPQKYKAHVSVVRKEIPLNQSVWGKYENKEVSFCYENIVYFGQVYAWLNVFSNDLEAIRIELGLPVSSHYTLPPSGFVKCFHTTIGNFKVM